VVAAGNHIFLAVIHLHREAGADHLTVLLVEAERSLQLQVVLVEVTDQVMVLVVQAVKALLPMVTQVLQVEFI
jgi:hypothetical protein